MVENVLLSFTATVDHMRSETGGGGWTDATNGVRPWFGGLEQAKHMRHVVFTRAAAIGAPPSASSLTVEALSQISDPLRSNWPDSKREKRLTTSCEVAS